MAAKLPEGAVDEMVDAYFNELRMSFDWMFKRVGMMDVNEIARIRNAHLESTAVEEILDMVFRQPPVSGNPIMWSQMDDAHRSFLRSHVVSLMYRIRK